LGPPKYPLDPTSSNQQLLKILQNNKTSPPSVIDSQPKTQRSGPEKKRSINTPFQSPTIQPGLVGSEEKGGELPLL
jgi:hypothetical protein